MNETQTLLAPLYVQTGKAFFSKYTHMSNLPLKSKDMEGISPSFPHIKGMQPSFSSPHLSILVLQTCRSSCKALPVILLSPVPPMGQFKRLRGREVPLILNRQACVQFRKGKNGDKAKNRKRVNNKEQGVVRN